MDNTRYKSIRGEGDFLYRYFTIEANQEYPKPFFDQMLGIWLMSMHIHPQQGMLEIVKFLDEKHEFNKN